MAKKIFFVDVEDSHNERNLFEEYERERNTAECMKCGTRWATKKQSINRCPYCGHDDVIVHPTAF